MAVQEAEEYDRAHRNELKNLREQIQALDAQLGNPQQPAGATLWLARLPPLLAHYAEITETISASQKPCFCLQSAGDLKAATSRIGSCPCTLLLP